MVYNRKGGASFTIPGKNSSPRRGEGFFAALRMTFSPVILSGAKDLLSSLQGKGPKRFFAAGLRFGLDKERGDGAELKTAGNQLLIIVCYNRQYK